MDNTSVSRKWYEHVGWRSNPFTLEIKPHLFVGYKQKLDSLLRSIEEGEKFILITGPTGAGKTTLLKWLSRNYFSLYLPKPPSSKEELSMIFSSTLLKPSLIDRLLRRDHKSIFNLPDAFNKRYNGKRFILLVDEAHESSIEVLEWVRSIADQIIGCVTIFAALPKFKENHLRSLETLNQRITLDMELDALSKDETIELIRKRIEDVGGRGIEPFTYPTIEAIYNISGGFPREVLKLCNELVHAAMERNVYVIDVSLIREPEKEDRKINIKEEFEGLTDKQKEILVLLSKTDGLTPSQIIKKIETSDYKTEIHALRAINNILRRLERDGFVSRSKRGRSYIYKVSPKVKSILVES